VDSPAKKPAKPATIELPKKGPFDKPVVLQPANAEFEKAIKGGVEPPKKEGRGGVRPGAGRPIGATEDFAAVNRLPEKANLALVPVLRIPFELWSKATKLPELALTKKEGEDLALPITQLLEFYFPGKIPEIAWVWLMLLGATSNILEPRLKLIAKTKNDKKVSIGGGPGKSQPTSQVPAAGPAGADMVPPAGGFVKNG
jgi:hypothetical protein